METAGIHAGASLPFSPSKVVRSAHISPLETAGLRAGGGETGIDLRVSFFIL
jgi:hypothetical protein